MGNFNLRQILYGKESSHGAGAAATHMWLGQLNKLGQNVKPKYPNENFGRKVAARRGIAGKSLYNGTLLAEDGCFQHLPVGFGCGLKGGVTATETTSLQHDYAWNFTPSLTTANNPDSLALQQGDDAQAWLSVYTMFEKYHISGDITQGVGGDPVKLEFDYFGRSLTETTFTPSIAPPTNMEAMNAKLARLWLDTSWANVGTTEMAGLLQTFDIEVIPGVHPVFRGSANKYFDKHSEGLLSVMGTFTLEGGAEAKALLEYLQAQSLVVAQFEILGNQIGTGVNSKFEMQFGGMVETTDPLASQDRGDTLSTVTLHGILDPTADKVLDQLNVITDINAY
jgi:hypothetical protein